MDKLTKLFMEFDLETKEIFDKIDEQMKDISIKFQGIKEVLQDEVDSHTKAVNVVKEFVNDLDTEVVNV